jgi:hypothetical protein
MWRSPSVSSGRSRWTRKGQEFLARRQRHAKAVKGGLDVADPETNDLAVIASAAIAVRIEVA